MTRESTQARAAMLDKPEIAYIARFPLSGDSVDFAVSEDDLRRDAQWFRSVLAAYGFNDGQTAIVTAFSWESAWFDPVRAGVNQLGGAFSNCEAHRWDASRLSTFLRLLEPTAVVGVTTELIEGLAEIHSGLGGLREVQQLFVRAEAAPAVERMGLQPRVFASLGPAIGMSATDGHGLVVNPAEWVVEALAGELVVSSTGHRQTPFVRQRTGVAGRVTVVDGTTRVLLP